MAATERGVYMPKTAGRGLGFTGGTLDKLESCPGVNTELTPEKFRDIALMLTPIYFVCASVKG